MPSQLESLRSEWLDYERCMTQGDRTAYPRLWERAEEFFERFDGAPGSPMDRFLVSVLLSQRLELVGLMEELGLDEAELEQDYEEGDQEESVDEPQSTWTRARQTRLGTW